MIIVCGGWWDIKYAFCYCRGPDVSHYSFIFYWSADDCVIPLISRVIQRPGQWSHETPDTALTAPETPHYIEHCCCSLLFCELYWGRLSWIVKQNVATCYKTYGFLYIYLCNVMTVSKIHKTEISSNTSQCSALILLEILALLKLSVCCG